ncbi:uncharacterized protein [Triticum aestivum]|uniref:uncharacterized protein n=1 Tax=Triticum aestivum TaxID=4565 RepID=UPI001D02A54C|nr:uncharacterized protein LOC123154407 [Triticum aestivum]
MNAGFTILVGNQSLAMSTSSSHSPSASPPLMRDDDGSAIANLSAGLSSGERPRASLSPDLPASGDLPLASHPPNTASLPVPPPPAAPSTPIPASIIGVLDFKLALDDSNFTRWRNYVTLVLARYHAEDHIRVGADRRLADPAWRDDDNTLVLLFFSTIDGDLLDIIAPAGSTAFTIWSRLHEYFLANEAEHTMHLGQEFRRCERGDLSINDYCRRLQGIAASLADVKEPVTDRALTLQMLDGLGPKFAMQAAILQATMPLPSFNQALSRLVLAELTLDKRAPAEGAQVPTVQHDDRGGHGGNGGGGGNGGSGGGRAGQLGTNRNGGRGGRGRGRGRGRGDTAGGRGAGGQPWLGYFAPMGMPFPPPCAP